MEIFIITVFLIITIITSILSLFYKKKLEEARKIIIGKKQAEEEKKEAIEKKQAPKSAELFDGLVEKTRKIIGKRTMDSYQVTDKMPEFKSVNEALEWAINYAGKSDDPCLGDVIGWGPVMKLEKYYAFKIIMSNVLNQVKSFLPKPEDG